MRIKFIFQKGCDTFNQTIGWHELFDYLSRNMRFHTQTKAVQLSPKRVVGYYTFYKIMEVASDFSDIKDNPDPQKKIAQIPINIPFHR